MDPAAALEAFRSKPTGDYPEGIGHRMAVTVSETPVPFDPSSLDHWSLPFFMDAPKGWKCLEVGEQRFLIEKVEYYVVTVRAEDDPSIEFRVIVFPEDKDKGSRISVILAHRW